MDGPVTSSPKLVATDRKKKQGFFGNKKPKPLDRPASSPQPSVVTSPLPVTTPSKAAKFFGIEAKLVVTGSPRSREYSQDDSISDDDDDAPVRPALAKQHSLPLLTRLKLGADRQTKFKEDIEPDQLKPLNTSKPNARGLRMLIPEFAGTRRAPVQQTTTATTRFGTDDYDDEIGHRSDSSIREPRFRIPAAPRPVPASMKRRRTRRKTARDVECMSPITEASLESLRHTYREGEDVTELGVISEYEYDDPPHSAPVLPRSHTESTLPSHDAFELDEADLSPTDEFYDEGATDEEDHNVVHPGTKVNVKQVHWQQAMPVHVRSPLQSIEDAYLDATEDEMRLEACRMTLARVEAQKQDMDAEIAVLRHEHERLKLSVSDSHFGRKSTSSFGDEGRHVLANVDATHDEESEDDDDDLKSLSSTIDLDKEPTVHHAKLMTFTRVTPGMVKLVDIPPRGKKLVSYAGSNTPVPNKLTLVEHQRQNGSTSVFAENITPASVSPWLPCEL